jgi:hypothetical protein
MEAFTGELGVLTLVESVRCLECGEVYSKPAAGGTVETNPGCPVCEYVGWIPIRLPRERSLPLRSAAGLPRHHLAPTR